MYSLPPDGQNPRQDYFQESVVPADVMVHHLLCKPL